MECQVLILFPSDTYILSKTINFWYPIVNPLNIKDILFHVIAFTEKQTTFFGNTVEYLTLHIHEKGKYTVRKYLLEKGRIKKR